MHRISAYRLVTTVEHALVIRNADFSSVLDVFLASEDRFVGFPDLVENIRLYAEWLCEQTSWNDEINLKQPTPLAVFRLGKLTSDDILHLLFTGLSPRAVQIFKLRYGLDGGEPRTLQDIAEIMSLTRERVRQITQRDMNKIRNVYRSSPTLISLAYLAKEHIDANKVVNDASLVTEIGLHLNSNRMGSLQNLLRLLFDEIVDFNIGVTLANRIWISTELPLGIVQKVIINTVDFLAEKMAPVHVSDIQQHLVENIDLPDDFVLSIDFLITCFDAEPQIEAVGDEYWGLTRWQGKTYDDIVMVLRELGKPLHFTEIARLVNERLSAENQISAHSVHAQLARYTNLFIRTDSGTFGLREWDPDAPVQPPKYVDIMEKVLEENGSPMTVYDIHEQVNVIRSAKFSSIMMYLGTHFKFRSYGNGMYGLAEWGNTTENQSGETVLLYCPRPLLPDRDNPRAFFESIIVGRDLLKQQPHLTAKGFLAAMLEWAQKEETNWINAQNAFDAWYAVGLIEHVDMLNGESVTLQVTIPMDTKLNDIRLLCLSALCHRILKMPELLLTLKRIARPTTLDIQKMLFGSERAGFDVPNRLNMLAAFEAVQHFGNEWRLTQVGETVLQAIPPQELPDYSNMEQAVTEADDTYEQYWEDELGLLDL
jgi:hypothetical protein